MTAPSIRCPVCSTQRCLIFDHVAKKVTVACPKCKFVEDAA